MTSIDDIRQRLATVDRRIRFAETDEQRDRYTEIQVGLRLILYRALEDGTLPR